MPNSRAIWAIGRPLVRTKSTASRLNSAVNWRRFLGCLSSMRTSSAQGRCPASGGKPSELLGRGEQQFADAVQRIAFAAPVAQGGLLGPPASLVDHHVGQPDGVEMIHDHPGMAKGDD